MKISPTLMALLASCAVFVLAPFIPSWFLNLTVGTTVGSLLLLVLVLIILQGDIVVGLATFLAVAALFLENRRRMVTKVTGSMPVKAPFKTEDLVDAPDLVPGEKHPPHKEADVDDYSFEPTEESGKNSFERVDETQDDKQPLETVPPVPSVVSEFLQDKGLAKI